ncbi:MAG: hypothetical protein U1A78_07690 [Polyangia bacterium]
MIAATQVQSFGDIRLEGDSQLVINQILQIAVAEIKMLESPADAAAGHAQCRKEVSKRRRMAP